ncbi:MAG TPA: hypothetical protein DCW29_04885 [Janthinobacterium sp.]|nr:hypothetical protein [Janthinobacterium sp.]
MGKVKGLLDYPLDYSGLMTFVIDAPLGFLAMLWYLAIFIVISKAFDAANKMPRRDKAARAIKKNQMLRDLFRRSLGVTLFFLILCFPFVHRYEIFRDHELRVRGAFDWDDTVYPFSTLRTFRRTVTGKGLIFWDLDFSDGRSLTTTAPSIALIEKIVSLPGVETNVAVSDHHIHPKAKP